MESCPMDRCFMCGRKPQNAICESCADGCREMAEDAKEVDAILNDARALTAWCQEDYFTDAPECSKGVKALQDAADDLLARIGRLRPNKQEQSDLDLDDAETTALIERDVSALKDDAIASDDQMAKVHRRLDALEGEPSSRISPVALACMIPTDKIPAAMAALGAELPGDDDPEDSDPELPADYDPSNDLHLISPVNVLAGGPVENAYTRVQLYILKLQGIIGEYFAWVPPVPPGDAGHETQERARSILGNPPDD